MSAQNRSLFEQNSMAYPMRTPFYPQNYGPNYGQGFPPNWSALSAGPMYPRMWYPNDPYYRPQNSVTPNEHSFHSSDCCLSETNRSGCRQREPFICDNCLKTNDESTGELVIDEVTNTSTNNGSEEVMIEEIHSKLRDTKLDFLDTTETECIKVVDRLERDLKKVVERTKQEITRFHSRETIRQRLLSDVNHVYTALVKTNDLKQWIRNRIVAQKEKIVDDMSAPYGVSAIYEKISKELPDFWTICESLVHNMSIELSTESPPEVEPKESVNHLDPIVSDITEDKDKNSIQQNEQILIDLKDKEPIIGKKFGDELPVIELPFYASGQPLVGVPQNLVNDKVSPPFERKIPDILTESMTEVKATKVVSKETVSDNNLISLTPSPSEKSSNENIVKSNTNSETNGPLVKNSHQQKVLDRLKSLRSDISEEDLFDAMNKTKTMINEFGHNGGKGFTGLKISEIVEYVIKFIDSVTESTQKGKSPSKQTNDSKTCGLCSTKMVGIENKISISCSHSFHVDCLEKWAQTNNRCPKCSLYF